MATLSISENVQVIFKDDEDYWLLEDLIELGNIYDVAKELNLTILTESLSGNEELRFVIGNGQVETYKCDIGDSIDISNIQTGHNFKERYLKLLDYIYENSEIEESYLTVTEIKTTAFIGKN